VMLTADEFGQAYESGFSRTVRFLIARGAQRDTAMEAAQAGWARGWEYLAQLRDERLLLTWINSIAINVYRRRRQKELPLAPLTEIPAPASVNLAKIDARRALQLCRPGERVLLEQYMQGFTAEDIASTEGVSHTAIRLRLLRARRAVRRNLQDRAEKLGMQYLHDAEQRDAA
jgi:DNA-directed RNA polymerase specialized sigma24 family protein